VKIINLEREALKAFRDCLQEIPFITVEREVTELYSTEARYDFRTILQVKGKNLDFIVEAKKNGEPRYARQAVNQLIRYLADSPNTYGVFIAPYISPEAAKICQQANIGTIDFAGNCNIVFDSVFIQKEGNPNPYTRKRYLKSLYSPKAERILRVLILAGPQEWKVAQLANEADVSLGLVSNVKKLLTDRDWIDAQTFGFYLTEPFALLEEWSQNYNYRRNEVLEFYTLLDVGEFEYKLEQICQQKDIRYGLTGFSGAARYAPTVRYKRAMAYIDRNLEDVIASLELKAVGSGANVNLLIPYDEGVFYQTQDIEAAQIVSPVQIYLDLMGVRGRGEEAAESLLDNVIRRLW